MNLKNIFESQKDFFYADTTMPINFRLLHLSKLKKSLIENEDKIYQALHKDLGKSKEESFISEFAPCIKKIDFFLKNLNSLSKPKKIKPSISNLRTKGFIYKKPFGVCLIVSSWNYPLVLSILPIVGALAGGNTCILKPHEFSKHTNEIINKIISEVFEQCYVKYFDGNLDILNSLLEFNFDYIFVTGNSETGKYISSKIYKNLTPTTFDIIKKNPCIVHNDANIEFTCKKIVYGKFLNAGQTHLATDYIWVHEKIKNEFIHTLIKTINYMFSEDPLNFKHYSKIINEIHFNRLINIIESLKDKVIFGGNYNKHSLKISPTIIDLDNIESTFIKNEIFGPILEIKPYQIVDEVIYSLKYEEPPNALYLFSNNKTLINKCLEIPFNEGCINDTLLHGLTNNIYPNNFKNNKIKKYYGEYLFNTFTHTKSILIKSSKKDIINQYPNSKNYNLKKLKSIFKIKF